MKTIEKTTAKITKIWAIAMVVTLCLTACSKDDDTPPPPEPSTEAAINSVSFTTSQNTTLYQDVTAEVNESAKTITATVIVIVPAAEINNALTLVPELNISSNATVTPENNIEITVGGSTGPVTYTVTAEDGTTTQTYTFTVTVNYINQVATQVVTTEDVIALYAIKNANPNATGKVADWNLNDASMAAIEASLTSNGVTLTTNNRVEELDIGDSNLSTLPAEIGNLTEIVRLAAYANNLVELPDEISHLTNLTRLSLTNNNLQDLPSSISNLNNLERLYIGSNNFNDGAIPSVVFELTTLKIFNFGNNSLEELPAEIGNLINLENLYLRNNDLRALPAEIGNLINVEDLDLAYNFLRVDGLPDEMANMSSLRWLNFFGNLGLNASTSASLSSTLCTFFNSISNVDSDLELTAC